MSKYLCCIFLLFSIKAYCQKKDTITQKGWLIYRYGDLLAFLPLKDQNKTPTYKNFFKEEKGEGQRMNNSYSAPPKLLVAKKITATTYKYDVSTDKFSILDKDKFFIQPVKYTYEIESGKDTADDMAGGWYFQINGKPIFHYVYYFSYRSGEVEFLNKKDSLLAQRGGRRRNISLYPPH